MTIKKKGDNNWEYCVYLGQDENGKKKYKRKSGFKTRKACIEEASTFTNKNSRNKNNNKTFKEIALMYLENCRHRGLKYNTLRCYEKLLSTLSKNFNQFNKYINTIKCENIFEYIHFTTHLSNNYRRKLIGFIKTIFKFAKKNKLIINNIFDDIPLPTIKNTIIDIWSESEIRNYMPKLKYFKYFDIVYLALETGLRIGELLGLTWDCIDFNRNTLTVKKIYVPLNGNPNFSDPKTNAGIRKIVLLQKSLDLLKHKFKNKTSQYIFQHPFKPNIPANPHTVSTHFKRFLIKNNIKPIRFHDLRHIHATLLLNKNINYKILSKRLGHSSVYFTLQTYTHVIPEHEIQLFKNISSLF